MNEIDIKTRQRVRAREAQLEARVDWHMSRVKGNLEYLKTDGIKILGSDVAKEVSASSPFLGKMICKLTGVQMPEKKGRGLLSRITGPRSSYSAREEERDGLNLASLTSGVMPALYTVGGMKILSYSLKGLGKIVRSGTRRVFGCKRK